MKKIILAALLIFFSFSLVSCSGNNSMNITKGSSEPTTEKSIETIPEPTQINTAVPTPSASPEPSENAVNATESEKPEKSYEEIVKEVLENEHEHDWVFSHFQERHPHTPEYKCSCGAVKIGGDNQAEFTMKITGPSSKHPHYMVQECSFCKGHFVNENLPTALTWELSGYTQEHPHYGIVKCSQCDYSYVNKAITAEGRGVCSLISEKTTAGHPHYLIVKCTYPGCDHSYTEKNATADWELETDSANYGVAHPHFIFGTCSYEGCNHSEKTNMTADWSWDDGVCSICGGAKDVLYENMSTHIRITGLLESDFQGHLHIPSQIEWLIVADIAANAFTGMDQITSIHIPDSMEIIGMNAFADCINLQPVILERCPVCNLESGLRDEHECQFCGGFTDIQQSGHYISNIGKNVFFIGENAFRNCNLIKTVTFGSKIRVIEEFAFQGCMNLEHAAFLSMEAPLIFPETFDGVSPEFKIFVPVGSVGYDAPEWEQFEVIYVEFSGE